MTFLTCPLCGGTYFALNYQPIKHISCNVCTTGLIFPFGVFDAIASAYFDNDILTVFQVEKGWLLSQFTL